ncbi:MAG: GNAT family N-acetyltransferase [Acidimicrobiales bacterium]
MTDTIRRNDEAGQYELVDDAGSIGARAEFVIEDDRVVMPHTESDPAREGQGLAGRVVQFALDDIRAGERHVVPLCPYVNHFIEKHPEYQSLVVH